MYKPLIIDLAGHSLTPDDYRRLSHPLVGGVVLFSRNFKDREQLVQLCAQIKSIGSDLLITVDHEGGRVQRFKTDGFTHLPSMKKLGDRWSSLIEKESDSDAAMAAMMTATAVGIVMGSELRACGVDLSFAPVLDLDYQQSEVIGDRSFHQDPRVVSLLAKSLMHGLLQTGMSNCAKHFPGHGYVKADSHVDVPVDGRRLSLIQKNDMKPFEWLASVTRSIMPAHVIYPMVDEVPAGFSSRWLQSILREQIKFDGAIFSDDLSMKGARFVKGKALTYVEAGLLALEAGCDLLLLCNQSLVKNGKPLDEWLEGMQKAWPQRASYDDAIKESRRLSLLPTQPPLLWDELMLDSAYVNAFEQVMAL